jgi:hypothetical protein
MGNVIRVMRPSPRGERRALVGGAAPARTPTPVDPRWHRPHRPRPGVPIPICELHHRSGASSNPRRATRSGCRTEARKRSPPSSRSLQQHAATSAHESRPGKGRAGAMAARQDFHLSLGSGRVAPGPGPAAVRWWPRPVRDKPGYALGDIARERTARSRRQEFRPPRDSSMRAFVL